MRLLLYTDSDYFSGAEKVLLSLAKHLRPSQGWLVVNPKIAARFALPETRPIRVQALADRSKLKIWLMARFVRLLRELQPTACLVNMQTPYANTLFLLAAWLCRVQVITVWHFAQENHQVRGLLRPLKLLAYKLAFGLSQTIVTVSAWHRNVLISQFGSPPSKVQTIPNGVAAPAIEQSRRSTEERILLSVGTLEPAKGQSILLEALVLIQQPWRLLMVGAGPDQVNLEQLTAKLNLTSRVSFEGYQVLTAPYYQQGDVFVHPSLAENLSMAIIEALSFGLPVIAHRLGGNPELITEGQNGWLIAPGDIAGWRQAISEALSCDLAPYRAQARHRFESRFTLTKMVESYQQLLENVSR